MYVGCPRYAICNRCVLLFINLSNVQKLYSWANCIDILVYSNSSEIIHHITPSNTTHATTHSPQLSHFSQTTFKFKHIPACPHPASLFSLIEIPSVSDGTKTHLSVSDATKTHLLTCLLRQFSRVDTSQLRPVCGSLSRARVPGRQSLVPGFVFSELSRLQRSASLPPWSPASSWPPTTTSTSSVGSKVPRLLSRRPTTISCSWICRKGGSKSDFFLIYLQCTI